MLYNFPYNPQKLGCSFTFNFFQNQKELRIFGFLDKLWLKRVSVTQNSVNFLEFHITRFFQSPKVISMRIKISKNYVCSPTNTYSSLNIQYSSFYIPLKPNFPLHNGQIYKRVITQGSLSVKNSFLTRLVPALFGLGFP